jgi:hypothetical protein
MATEMRRIRVFAGAFALREKQKPGAAEHVVARSHAHFVSQLPSHRARTETECFGFALAVVESFRGPLLGDVRWSCDGGRPTRAVLNGLRRRTNYAIAPGPRARESPLSRRIPPTERRRNRTFQAGGCPALPVLKPMLGF